MQRRKEAYPQIGEVMLRRGPRPLVGPIALGEVFAWEPDLPHARELCVVSRIEQRPHDERLIWTWDIGYQCETWNEEGKFREAVVRTRLKPFPIAPPKLLPPKGQGWEQYLDLPHWRYASEIPPTTFVVCRNGRVGLLCYHNASGTGIVGFGADGSNKRFKYLRPATEQEVKNAGLEGVGGTILEEKKSNV